MASNPALPRGFKAACERIAAEERADLRLKPYAPLNPRTLADAHGVPVCSFTELHDHAELDGAITHLTTGAGAHQLSAFTVCRGTRRLIAYNDSHSTARQNSDIAHELAHLLLEHEPDQQLARNTILTERTWTPAIEAQAAWCAGVLLLPRPACTLLAHHPDQRDTHRDRYGVSDEMINYRLRATGAIKQAARR